MFVTARDLSEMVRVAARETHERRAASKQAIMKHGDRQEDHVTDILADEMIRHLLAENDPGASIISEEQGRTLRGSPHVYIVDPLDGIDSGTVEEHVEAIAQHGIRPRASDFQKYGTFATLLENGIPRLAAGSFPEQDLHFAVESGHPTIMHHGRKTYAAMVADSTIISVGTNPAILTDEYRAAYVPFIEATDALEGQKSFGATCPVREAIGTIIPDEHGLMLNPRIYVWDLPVLALTQADAKIAIFRAEDSLAPRQFSYDDFDLTGQSDRWRQPYAVAAGHPRHVDRFVEQLERLR